MSDPVEALILDLLEWVHSKPRSYGEVMEAWRTSCPRLPVWEEANARGLLTQVRDPERGPVVAVTDAGLEYLAAARPRQPIPAAAAQHGAAGP